METLREKEWITLNKVILEIYSIENMAQFAPHILQICKNLVPYDMGYFLIYDEQGNCLVKDGYSAAEGMNEELFASYLSEYYAKDYLQYFLSLFKESACYRDTDIMEEHLRSKTVFFCEFMKPNGISYGSGCVLWKDKSMLGILNFFRSERLGDFTEKEMFILNMICNHLAQKLYQLYLAKKKCTQDEMSNKMRRFAGAMGMTNRETESFILLMTGHSNQEIADHLTISLSTVKKHVVKIFDKCHVSSRGQMRQCFENYFDTKGL